MENKLKNSTLVRVCEQIMAANMAEYGDERIARQESARDFWDLITGDADREEILEKYNIECLRVCEMCSDKCAAEFFDESVPEFKYRMSDENFIKQSMEWDKCEKKYEDLTEEERGKYLDMAMDRTDFYWTEWE